MRSIIHDVLVPICRASRGAIPACADEKPQGSEDSALRYRGRFSWLRTRRRNGGQPKMAVPLKRFFAAPLGLWDVFYDLLPQHWRAGLNSSAARRALSPHAFRHWSWRATGVPAALASLAMRVPIYAYT